MQLNNIRIYYQGNKTAPAITGEVPEQADKYPEPGMFGEAPAYGFFIRHARAIQLNNVEVKLLQPDTRPAYSMDDVKDLNLNRVKAPLNNQAKAIQLNNVTGLKIFERLDLANNY